MEFIVVSEQLTYILYSFVFGLVASLVYFGIKILRLTVGVNTDDNAVTGCTHFLNRIKIKKIRGSKTVINTLFIHIIDIIYWIFIAIAFSIFVFYFNHGRIRWYLVLAAVFGFWIFYHSIGQIIMHISKYIVYIIKSFTKLFFYGIILVLRIIFKPVSILIFSIKIKIKYYWELKKLHKYIFVKGESNGT